jgi:hypothetical protein
MKHSFSLDKMLEEKKACLMEKMQDLKVWEVVQVEVQACGIHPQENPDLLAELVEL